MMPIYNMNFRIPRPQKPSKRIDPVEYYLDEDFRKRYRFTKDTFRFLCDEFEDDLGRKTARHYALSTETQLAIALRYYATGSFLEVVGDTLMAVAKSTVSQVVYDVSLALSQKLDDYIIYPTDQNKLRKMTYGFKQIADFPCVVGAVDGTHVRIQAPSRDREPLYVDKKHQHSIAVQGICDYEGRFLNIVVDWPGSVHDSTILQRSKIGAEFATGQRRGILLGDNGYGCQTWLLTPFLNPVGDVQKKFNVAHKKTRCVIERAFGMWKRRFHVLHSEIRMSPIRACRVIAACAVLHNIAKSRNDDEDFDDDEISDDEDDIPPPGRTRQAMNTYRNHFAQKHFS